jgi:small subunit ribosomal protein S23
MPLALAYEQAVAQFHSLKSEHHLATLVAAHEAEYFGAEFGPRQSDDSFQRELVALKTRGAQQELDDAAALAARKRWRVVGPQTGEEGVWSQGEEYVRLWQAGVRPNYIPVRVDSEVPVAVAVSDNSQSTGSIKLAKTKSESKSKDSLFF